MKRRTKWILGTIVVLVLPGFIQYSYHQGWIDPTILEHPAPPRMSDADFNRQKSATIGLTELRASMRNPDSFKLERILDMPGAGICYTYRAQNGFGGMNVEHAVMMNGELLGKGMVGYNESWNKNCADREGTDITEKVNAMLAYVATHP